jgi:hypothetical protein
MSQASAVSSAPARPAWRVWLSRLAPYLVAGAVITFILQRYSLEDIRAEMARGESLPLFPLALVTYIVTLLCVAGADRIVVAGLIPQGAPGYLAMARGKAASVLLHIVHYALGQGAYAAWLGRKTGIGVSRTGGLIAYIIAAELCSVCVFATVVILVGSPAVPSALLFTVAGISIGLVLVLLIAPLTRLERFAIFEAWTRVGQRRGLLQLGIRMLQHTTSTTGAWLAARAFGMEIPLPVMLSYMPIIMVVASLPVNVAGFGAVQGAWLLLSPWAPGEQILAFSVIWQVATAVALVIRGLPFVRGVMAEIREGAQAATGLESSPAARHTAQR